MDQKKQYRKVIEPVLVYAEKGDDALAEGELSDSTMSELAEVRSAALWPARADKCSFRFAHSESICRLTTV